MLRNLDILDINSVFNISNRKKEKVKRKPQVNLGSNPNSVAYYSVALGKLVI